MLHFLNNCISLNVIPVTRKVAKIDLRERILAKAVNIFIVAEKIPELEVRAILSKPRKIPNRRLSTGRSTKRFGKRRISFQLTTAVILINITFKFVFSI